MAAELGADGIEINARSEIRPSELSRTGIRQIKKMLGDYQLAVCCVNLPSRFGYDTSENLEQRVDATKAAMSMAYDLGCNVVSNRIGKIPDSDSPSFSTMIQAMEDIGRHGSHVGATFAIRTGDNQGAALREMLQSLGPSSPGVDFDPAELLMNRLDIESTMDELAEFVLHFRARDAVRDLSRSENVEVQLGRGSVDLPPLLAKLEEKNYQGYMTVQCQRSDDSRLQLGQSLEFLDNLFH